MYDYDRTVTAASNNFEGYDKKLEALQMDFTGGVAKVLFDYIETLHRRLSKRPPFDNISGFLSWDWGTPKDLEDSNWGIRVWQKDSSTYPGNVDPNLYVTLEFSGQGSIVVYVEAGSKQLYSKTYPGSASPSKIGMAIGEAWEKRLTGSVDYGDF